MGSSASSTWVWARSASRSSTSTSRSEKGATLRSASTGARILLVGDCSMWLGPVWPNDVMAGVAHLSQRTHFTPAGSDLIGLARWSVARLWICFSHGRSEFGVFLHVFVFKPPWPLSLPQGRGHRMESRARQFCLDS